MPLGGSLIFVGLLGVLPIAVSTALEAAGACLLVYALATQYGSMLTRPTAPLVLGTVMLEGLFVFGGLVVSRVVADRSIRHQLRVRRA